MSKEDFDWSAFKRRVYIKNSSSKQLFLKWVTSRGLQEWFIKTSEYKEKNGKTRSSEAIAEVGNKYEWTFHNGSKVAGKILDLIPNEKFKFTFGKSDPDATKEVTVTVTFFDTNDGAGFDLLQENMVDSEFSKVNSFISCNMSWEFHLMNLKSLIESKHDLRKINGSRMHVDAPSAYPLENYSWTEFSVKEYIPADLETVFNYWAISGKITQWFIKEAEYISPDGQKRKNDEIIKTGDLYTWNFGKELTMKGKIIEVINNKFLHFTFGRKEPDSDEYVQVRVHFESVNGETQIKIYENNIADNSFGQVNYNLSCILGWSYYMTNLRSIVESGYDLREKDPVKDLETRSKTLNLQ